MHLFDTPVEFDTDLDSKHQRHFDCRHANSLDSATSKLNITKQPNQNGEEIILQFHHASQ